MRDSDPSRLVIACCKSVIIYIDQSTEEYEGKEEEFFEKSGWRESDIDLCFVGEQNENLSCRVLDFYDCLTKSHPEVISSTRPTSLLDVFDNLPLMMRLFSRCQ